ncbi:UPF0687 protein C20orf27-like protein [Frankliniella fusca]|uniref:Adipose-secreted signaling protein n=1 Tax=Frankliniella fusca TaxID=407009 RepID=A0AAE1LG25_9NEOP|nr:UPF0687 protein C20orf27-like protein [Frankliniella fusca]
MDHHVRFGDETLVTSKDNNIVIQRVGSDNLAVHLGFLQMGHRYHISVFLSSEMCPCGPLQSPSPDDGSLAQYFNPNCHLLSMSQCDEDSGGWQLKVEYFAHKEKLMKEDLFLLSPDENHNINLKLTFHARVLGRGKGTPLLRNGIHSIGVELEDEGEASDWQGFG